MAKRRRIDACIIGDYGDENGGKSMKLRLDEKMKFVALISGGKDSIYATLQAIENGHELVCCAHLAPLSIISKDDTNDESYMYQTAGSEAVQKQVEECIGVPYYVREIYGRSKNISLIYDNNTSIAVSRDDTTSSTDIDEVEDLYLLLKQIQIDHPEIAGVSSGAILSTYQRTRIENVCCRLNLTSLSFLWRMSCQRALLDSILDDGEIHAILVRVACPPGLLPHKHLGKSLHELRDNGIIDDIQQKYQTHPAGEGGEYETLVLDCPKLFKYGRLVLDETEVITDTCDDSVGNLRIIKCSVVKKNVAVVTDNNTHHVEGIDRLHNQVTQQIQIVKSNLSNDTCATQLQPRILYSESSNHIHRSMNLPNVRLMKGGLCHITAILAPIAAGTQLNDEAFAAVQEFLSIRQILSTILSRLFPNDKPPSSSQDIIFVHLYLSEMSHFAKINHYYQEYFGTQLPPSRACVAVGKNALPGGRRVMMDCIFQRGSGAYLRQGDCTTTTDYDNNHENTSFLVKSQQNKHHFLRKTLHVQSISTWAPVCIGPYSQTNVIRSSLVFLAGMIGLVPQSMILIKSTCANVTDWEVQLYQSWRNTAAVLDGLEGGGGKLEDCLGGLVYLSAGALKSSLLCSDGEPSEAGTINWERLWKTARSICCDAICTNAGVVMGSVDGAATSSPFTPLDPSLYDEDGVLYGGYEDEGTWKEMLGSSTTPSVLLTPTSVNVPLLMVCLPELPANAEAEVELILASRRAASCLHVRNSPMTYSRIQCATTSASPSHFNGGIMWNCGYDHTNPSSMNDEKEQSCVVISSISRFVGLGCACVSTVIARLIPNNDSLIETADAYDFNMEEILSKMIDFSTQHGELSSLFNIEDVLNVRLYYIAASVSRRVDNGDALNNHLSSIEIEYTDDGTTLRTQLHSVLQQKSKHVQHGNSVNIPAYTIVPVLGMHLDDDSGGVPLLAMQVTMVDMMRMEAEMWIRHNRQYNYDN